MTWTNVVNAIMYSALLSPIAVGTAMAQQVRVLMEDTKARVTAVEVFKNTVYTVRPTTSYGAVWIALDDNATITRGHATATANRVRAGDAKTVEHGADVQFRNDNQSTARLIIVEVKEASQELTIGLFDVTTSLEDASDRNDTLLVAVSALQLRDTWNTGDESEWLPSKPNNIRMNPGDARWIRPGIHHLKNLGRRPAKFVLVEW